MRRSNLKPHPSAQETTCGAGRDDGQGAAAMAQLPDSFPEPALSDAQFLIRQVQAAFGPDLAAYGEFLDLLGGFYRGEIADSRAVLARLFAFVEGHPDLVQSLRAFLRRPFQHEAEPVREDPPKRPRRERRLPAAAAPVDPDCAAAMRFMERVRLADAGLYDRVLALLFHVRSEVKLDANQIYDEAREIFGPAHSHLLRGFTEYLPTGRDFLRRRAKKEPPEEHRAPAPKRKAPAIPADAAGKKKRRVDGRKTTSRRASPVAVDTPKSDDTAKSDKYSEFRKWWEFEATYSRLVITLRRTKKALEELRRKPKKKSREEAEPAKESPEEVKPSPGHDGRPRTFEELYPGRECQEVLREMYGDKLALMRKALEDGARTELALKTIKRRLRKLEEVAVKMARERRDPARVERRMCKLAVDRVGVLLDRAKEAAASNGGGPCEHPAGMSRDQDFRGAEETDGGQCDVA